MAKIFVDRTEKVLAMAAVIAVLSALIFSRLNSNHLSAQTLFEKEHPLIAPTSSNPEEKISTELPKTQPISKHPIKLIPNSIVKPSATLQTTQI